MTPQNWEERFDKDFMPRVATPGTVEAYIRPRIVELMNEVKDFIRTEIAAAEQRKVAEIREAVENIKPYPKMEIKGSTTIVDGAISKSTVLSLLQPDN